MVGLSVKGIIIYLLVLETLSAARLPENTTCIQYIDFYKTIIYETLEECYNCGPFCRQNHEKACKNACGIRPDDEGSELCYQSGNKVNCHCLC